jgi:hypothetical protein
MRSLFWHIASVAPYKGSCDIVVGEWVLSIRIFVNPGFNKQSYYEGRILDFITDNSDNEFGLLYLDETMISERTELELEANPNISYEYMLNSSVGVGFKTEAYLLAYYGLTYLTFYPTIVFRIQ